MNFVFGSGGGAGSEIAEFEIGHVAATHDVLMMLLLLVLRQEEVIVAAVPLGRVDALADDTLDAVRVVVIAGSLASAL